MRCRPITLCSLLVLAADAMAAPPVLFEREPTRSMEAFWTRVESSQSEEAVAPRGHFSQAAPGFILPIETPSMSPGPVKPRPLPAKHQNMKLVGTQPLFLIGTGSYSREWLKKHSAELKRFGALGLVVAAKTRSDLHAIIALADGIPMFGGSAEDIARELSIRHYPVIIASDGVRQ